MAYLTRNMPPWRPALTQFRHRKEYSRKIYEECLQSFQDIIQSKVLGETIAIRDLISDEDTASIQKALQHEPTIVFMGQVNSGKSSLANEILGGGTWLPVAAEPCTSRLVHLKYSPKAYYRTVPFGEAPSRACALKGGVPKLEQICLTDEEKKNPENFKIQLEFEVNNEWLRPNLQVVDLPGWNENRELDKALKEIIQDTSVETLVLVYVLDGNKMLRGLDLEFIDLVKKEFPDLNILYVCNKSDYESESLKNDYGEGGELQMTANNQLVYNLGGTCEPLQNKALGAFQKLQNHGLLDDSWSFEHCPQYHALSARVTKELRLTSQHDAITDFFQKNFEKFQLEVAHALGKKLQDHTLNIVRLLSVVVFRFYDGCLQSRKMELRDEICKLNVLHMAGKKEEEAYTKCLVFLRDESAAFKSAIDKAITEAKPKILRKAIDIVASDCESKSPQPVPVKVAKAIALMFHRQIHETISEKMEDVQDKYLSVISVIFNVVFSSSEEMTEEFLKRSDLPESEHRWRTVSDALKFAGNSEDEAVQAALSVCFFIRRAVHKSLFQMHDNTLPEAVTRKMGAATLGFSRVTEKWKKEIAEACMSLVDSDLLATTILGHCSSHLEKSHAKFVENLGKKVALRSATENITREQQKWLETNITPKVNLIMLKLVSLRHQTEKGEPQIGEIIGKGRHNVVYHCTGWGGLEHKGALVVKQAEDLCPETWKRAARGSLLRRSLKASEETDSFVVRQYGTVISPLDSPSPAFFRIMEYRHCTLPEALKRGLTTEKRKLIALDVTRALTYIVLELNLIFILPRAEIVSLDSSLRGKLDFSKFRESPSFSTSWLGIPSFHLPPEDEGPMELADRLVVYSLGCLLWEIFNESCKPPVVYSNCSTVEDIRRKVVEEGVRPERLCEFEEEWWQLMQDCWKPLTQRPALEVLLDSIKTLVKHLMPSND